MCSKLVPPDQRREDLSANAAYVHQVFCKEMKAQAEKIHKELAEDIINSLVPNAKPGPRLAMRVVILEALRGDSKAHPDGIQMVMKFFEKQREAAAEAKENKVKGSAMSQTRPGDTPVHGASGAMGSEDDPRRQDERDGGAISQTTATVEDNTRTVRGVQVNASKPLKEQGVPIESDMFDEYEESWMELRGWQGCDV